MTNFRQFSPESPLGALERFFLGTSQPNDVDILHKILFDADGRLSDPYNCGSCSLGYRPFTTAVCEKWGWELKSWHMVVIAIFGNRAIEEYPTELLAFLTAYDALAGTSHLGAEDNLSSEDQCLWQADKQRDE